MVKFARVLVLEAQSGKDKHKDTEGGKYRRDSPWLVEAFQKKGAQSEIIFITREDTAEVLMGRYPDAAFLGRVNPMDYEELRLSEYFKLLNDLKTAGRLLGPDPQHMDMLGSKMIVYRLRDTTLGVEGVLFHPIKAMADNPAEIDAILPPTGPPRVLKMLRGSTGLGVWKLENVANTEGKRLAVTDAYNQTTEEVDRASIIPKFLDLCKDEEGAISMPYMPLIGDGELRFLMSRDSVLQIVHKRPVDANAFTATLRSGAVYTTIDPASADHKSMADAMSAWARHLKVDLELAELPYWWSVDAIEDEVTNEQAAGDRPHVMSTFNRGRRLVLSEINCSCLGLVADTSAEAKLKGMKLAEMIADIVL